MRTSLRGFWTDAAAYQRVLYAIGALLMASGLFHLGVFAVDGGPWTGPVSWRKPVTFGLSFGITTITLAWILTFLPTGRLGRGLSGVFGVAVMVEVALVSMQQWRGAPSHFNETTAFDAVVFGIMGLAVLLILAVIVVVTGWSLVSLTAPSSLAWAIRLGLLLVVSQAVGGAMISAGSDTFGTAGAGKVPHAVTLHAVQVLPALAWLLGFADVEERIRLRVVVVGAAGYVAFSTVTLLQAFGGRTTFDLSPTVAGLLMAGAALLVSAVLWAVTSVRRRPAAV